ncbi:MAG TPA: hypothetical protein PKY59_22970 [Pyrinomonadaceae bacterium]|nr:hypothetical protein [Pyrinomonadaceae bacterium]
MKNSFNFSFAILLLVVLGCACPKLDELKQGRNTSEPPPTPVSTNTSTKPTEANSGLTKAKFEQLKVGMKKSEVVDILGDEGSEVSTTTGGGMTYSTYKWDGENYASIIIVFQNDKVMSKTQYGLK